MLVEISGEITPERMKGWSQSKNNTQLWILYIENPKDTIRKLLEIISEYGTAAGYKIDTQKTHTFLYTNNEKWEREIKESIPFTIETKRIKYLGIKLPK